MKVRVLGPVEVRDGEQRLALGGATRLAVLAALAVDAGRPVPIETLIDRVWGEAPPDGARDRLYVHLSRLRSVLGPADRSPRPARLERLVSGYQLTIDCDLGEFRALAGRARTATDPIERAEQLERALALWRGVALGGLPGPWAARVRAGLEHERVAVLVGWAQALRRLGRAGETIPRLRGEAEQAPLVEPLAEALIRALAETGDPAGALRYFDAVRRGLAAELGTDPGPELRELHQAMLHGTAASASGRRAAPAQLPRDVTAFTGRRDELAQLDRGGSVLTISGPAGVGKTALAVRWAHRAAAGFPDGQLYADLRGYDPDEPVSPTDVLSGFLRALGIAERQIPIDPGERAAAYRTETTGRRVLVVLDNAATAEQVRPLLPGASSCSVVVTSRDRLAGLVALQGARPVDLDLLPPAEAVQLLRRLVGARVDAEPAAAAALAEQCARLPLALRIAAELAAARPATPLGDLVTELDDQQRRLDALGAGDDPRGAVSVVFSWSYRNLAPGPARVFRLLGVHPGVHFEAHSVAALAGTEPEVAARALAALAGGHLLHPAGAGRYGMHDLLRAYATRVTTVEDSADDRRAALTRLLDYYLGATAAAMDLLYPAEANRRPKVAAAGSPPLADPVTARSWLDTERATLVAVAAFGRLHGWPGHAVTLAALLFRYFVGGSHHADGLVVNEHALRAARSSGDLAGEAQARHGIGAIHLHLGRDELARGHFEQALALHREAGDRGALARTLGNLGLTEARLGRSDAAAGHLSQALGLHREAGDLEGEARVRHHLGVIEIRRQNYRAAVEHLGRALRLHRQAGGRSGEAHVLSNLGAAESRLGRHPEAVQHLREALALHQELGNRSGQAHAMDNLGAAATLRGRWAEAAAHHGQAVAVFREIGDRDGECWALNGLGEAALGAGRPGEARTHHEAALAAADRSGAQDQRARAHAGLARSWRALGDTDRAREHDEQAYFTYAELGLPEAEEIRARLG